MGVYQPNPKVMTVDKATSVKNVSTIAVSNGDLTVAGRTATIDTSGSGSVPTLTEKQIAFGDAANLMTSSSDFTVTPDTGSSGPKLQVNGNKPIIVLKDDTGPTDYETQLTQSGASLYFTHEDSAGNTSQAIRITGGNTIFNGAGTDRNFTVEGKTTDPVTTGGLYDPINNICLDAGTSKIGFGIEPTGSTAAFHIKAYDDSPEAFRIDVVDTDGTDESTPFVIDGTGRVGIGTATPLTDMALTLNGDGSSYEGLAFQVGGSTKWKLSTDATSFYWDSQVAGLDNRWRIRDSAGLSSYITMGPRGAAQSAYLSVNPSAYATIPTNAFTVDGNARIDSHIGIGMDPDSTEGGVQMNATLQCLDDVITFTADFVMADSIYACGGQKYFLLSASNRTITLPESSPRGRHFWFTSPSDGGGGSITIQAQGSDTVNGSSSISRGVDNSVNHAMCYDTGKWVVGNE